MLGEMLNPRVESILRAPLLSVSEYLEGVHLEGGERAADEKHNADAVSIRVHICLDKI